MNFNTWIGVGRLTDNPVIRYTQKGKAVTTATIAINKNFAGREDSLFMECQVWGKWAEDFKEWGFKGRCVLVQGSLRQDSWTDRGGNERKTIVCDVGIFRFMSPGKDKQDHEHVPSDEQQREQDPATEKDDIPF